MKQLHAYFVGQVQGVFFRDAAKKLADKLNIAGFVQNLPDGRVELSAQGDENNLKSLLDQLGNQYDIDDTKIDWTDVKEELSIFEIKY